MEDAAYVLGSVGVGGYTCLGLCMAEIHLGSFPNWSSPVFLETGAQTLNALSSLSIPPPPHTPCCADRNIRG